MTRDLSNNKVVDRRLGPGAIPGPQRERMEETTITKIAVIADDLTGANDTGVQFARTGRQVVVPLGDADAPPDTDVMVLNTDSRHLAPADAAARVQYMTGRALAWGADVLFKKLDSTMRGNPGAELAAMLSAGDADFALLCPAYPANGRTVVNGDVVVGGVPLADSPASRDPATPVHHSGLAKIIAEGYDGPTAHLPLVTVRQGQQAIAQAIGHALAEGQWVLAADAATDADLDALVAGALGSGYRPLWAGAAGLGAALAAALPPAPRAEVQAGPRTASVRRPTLAVVASANPRTREQLQQAVAGGAISVVAAPTAAMVAGDRLAIAEVAEAAIACLQGGEDVAVLPDQPPRGAPDPEAGRALARHLGMAAALAAQSVPLGALFLSGGDTATAVLSALGAHGVRILGEVAPGIPYGRVIGGAAQVPVVTKAGGFGSDDALSAALKLLHTL